MGLFDQPVVAAEDAAHAQQLKFNRRAVVVLCALTAFIYGIARASSRDALANFSFALGSTLGLLFIPALLAFFVSRSSEKWHYTFAGAFAVVFALTLLGSLR